MADIVLCPLRAPSGSGKRPFPVGSTVRNEPGDHRATLLIYRCLVNRHGTKATLAALLGVVIPCEASLSWADGSVPHKSNVHYQAVG